MPLYGHKKAVVDERSGPFELREISLEFEPEDLRRVARFLHHYADRIESGEWRGNHAHIEYYDPTWPGDHPEADVIILNPDPDPPAVVT
jgi:hypothetical protein